MPPITSQTLVHLSMKQFLGGLFAICVAIVGGFWGEARYSSHNYFLSFRAGPSSSLKTRNALLSDELGNSTGVKLFE